MTFRIEWQVPVDIANGQSTIKNYLALNGTTLWAIATPSAPFGYSELRGYDSSTGSLVKTIQISSILGINVGSDSLIIDQNGLLWFSGSDSFVNGFPTIICFDTNTETVVASFYIPPPALGKGRLLYDSTNNLIWTKKASNSTIAGISTVSYTETKTLSTTYSHFTYVESTDEIWAYSEANHQIKIYDVATLTLQATLSTETLFGVNNIHYLSNDTVLLTSAYLAPLRLYSVLTRTVIQTNDTLVDPFEGFYSVYISKNNTILGDVSNYTDNSYLSFRNADDISIETTFSSTEFQPGLLFFDSGYYVDNTEGSIYSSYVDDATGQQYLFKLSIGCTPRDISVREITLCSTEDTSSSNTNLENYDSFNRELILDLNLQAFSVYDLAHNNDTYIRDYIEVPSYIVTFTEDLIYVGSELVTDTALVNLTVIGSVPKQENRNTDERREPFKFIVTTGTSISIAEYKDYSFVDWKSIDGVGYEYNSYLLTGYELSGDMVRQKQTTYLKLFFDRTEDAYTLDSSGNVVLAHQSGCKVQSQWDWNNSADNGKWGVPFQGYRLLRPQPIAPAAGDTFTYGERVIVTKNKLRGRGHCLSLLFVSECGKDTKLLGWGLGVTGLPIRRGKNTTVA